MYVLCAFCAPTNDNKTNNNGTGTVKIKSTMNIFRARCLISFEKASTSHRVAQRQHTPFTQYHIDTLHIVTTAMAFIIYRLTWTVVWDFWFSLRNILVCSNNRCGVFSAFNQIHITYLYWQSRIFLIFRFRFIINSMYAYILCVCNGRRAYEKMIAAIYFNLVYY